jgi:hypothetical protein
MVEAMRNYVTAALEGDPRVCFRQAWHRDNDAELRKLRTADLATYVVRKGNRHVCNPDWLKNVPKAARYLEILIYTLCESRLDYLSSHALISIRVGLVLFVNKDVKRFLLFMLGYNEC